PRSTASACAAATCATASTRGLSSAASVSTGGDSNAVASIAAARPSFSAHERPMPEPVPAFAAWRPTPRTASDAPIVPGDMVIIAKIGAENDKFGRTRATICAAGQGDIADGTCYGTCEFR